MQAFHVFHTACVIHWILLCEYEMITDRLVNQNARQKGKKKIVTGSGKEDRDIKHVFCPECQGAGLIIADGLEQPKLCSLSQVCSLHRQSFPNPTYYKISLPFWIPLSIDILILGEYCLVLKK